MFRVWTLRLLLCCLFGGLMAGCKKKDLNDPVIVIEGDNPLFIELGGTWEIPVYSANDLEDGDLTADVTVDDSEVNTGRIGAWHVIFSVSDHAGNTVHDTLHVNVIMGIANYTGSYSVEEIRDIDGDGVFGEADVPDEIAVYTLTIAPGIAANELAISNFGDYGDGVETTAEYTGDLNEEIEIDTFIPDEDGIHLTGSGQVTTGTITSIIISFDYQAADGAITVPCIAQCTKI